MHASANGHKEVVQLLLDRNATGVDTKDNVSAMLMTLCMLACLFGVLFA